MARFHASPVDNDLNPPPGTCSNTINIQAEKSPQAITVCRAIQGMNEPHAGNMDQVQGRTHVDGGLSGLDCICFDFVDRDHAEGGCSCSLA